MKPSLTHFTALYPISSGGTLIHVHIQTPQGIFSYAIVVFAPPTNVLSKFLAMRVILRPSVPTDCNHPLMTLIGTLRYPPAAVSPRLSQRAIPLVPPRCKSIEVHPCTSPSLLT
jgi:hypothetical protein